MFSCTNFDLFPGHSIREIYSSLLICVTRLVVDNPKNQQLIVGSPGIVSGVLALTKVCYHLIQ